MEDERFWRHCRWNDLQYHSAYRTKWLVFMLFHRLVSAYTLSSRNGGVVNPSHNQVSCPVNNYYWGVFAGEHFCVRCPDGRTTSGCKDCKADKDASSCRPCPAGFFLPHKSDQACIACPAGKWQSKEGTRICRKCPAGTYTPLTGQHTCYACRPGEYQPQSGETVCWKCPACPPGTFGTSSNGATSSTACSCRRCPTGRFSTRGFTECFDCPQGRYSTANAEGVQKCESCPLGYYSGTDPAALSCTACEKGLTTHARQSVRQSDCRSAQVHHKIPCRAGRYMYRGQSEIIKKSKSHAYFCVKCPVGRYGHASGCEPCPKGKYQRSLGQVACKSCLKGGGGELCG